MRLALALLTGLAAAPAAAEDLRWLKEPLLNSTYGVRALDRGPAAVLRNERAVTFPEVDANRNGVWDAPEIAAAFGPLAGDVVMTFDANGDGRITRRELLAFDDGQGWPDGHLFERASR